MTILKRVFNTFLPLLASLCLLCFSCNNPDNKANKHTDKTKSGFVTDKGDYVTEEIEVIVGDKSKTYSLKELKRKDKITFNDYEAIGGKKGRLGVNDWTGASLKALLLEVEPEIANQEFSEKEIIITSIDGWVALIKWPELFGTPRGGELLYNIKGCNECHGFYAEGTAPEGKLPAPALINMEFDFEYVNEILRKGSDLHAKINPFTKEQLSDSELKEIMVWLEKPDAPPPPDAYRVDPNLQRAILAYKMNGKKMNGKNGLIQLIVEMDEFSSRYSHWVSRVEVK